MSDFVRHPLEYPGIRSERSILLLPNADQPLDAGSTAAGRLDDELLAHRAVPMDLRTPVAAVGSNASPAVIRAKLLAGGLAPVVPMIRGQLHHLRISPSAHVSRPGFVPAAPARVVGDVAEVVVGWFDAEQLARLDATEPNYDRIRLPARDHRLDLDWSPASPAVLASRAPDAAGWPDSSGWSGPDGVDVYRSKWGVLTGLDGPWHLGSQRELSAMFAKRGIDPWASTSAMGAARALALSERLREQVRQSFRRLGLAGPGLRGTMGVPPGRIHAGGKAFRTPK